jgi:hypothetical protein
MYRSPTVSVEVAAAVRILGEELTQMLVTDLFVMTGEGGPGGAAIMPDPSAVATPTSGPISTTRFGDTAAFARMGPGYRHAARLSAHRLVDRG